MNLPNLFANSIMCNEREHKSKSNQIGQYLLMRGVGMDVAYRVYVGLLVPRSAGIKNAMISFVPSLNETK